jgi:predicted ATPase
VLDALGTLVDRSFVALTDDREAPRYRLLDTPRAIALEQLVASGESDGARATPPRCGSTSSGLMKKAGAGASASRPGLSAWNPISITRAKRSRSLDHQKACPPRPSKSTEIRWWRRRESTLE